MVQLQRNLFRYNWLKADAADYPRYRTTRPEFDTEFLRFTEFVREETGVTITPVRWEVVYINDLPSGSVWKRPDEWSSIFTFPLSPKEIPGCALGSFQTELNYSIEAQEAWLNVQIMHGKPKGGSTETLRVILTAWGRVSKLEDVGTKIDSGRKTIVASFGRLMSEAAREYWNRE